MIVNKYPIYILSKGRWESRLTSKSLEKMNLPYNIVVEPKEYDQYASVIDPRKIIQLPDNFSELKQGGIPTRNFIFEHSIERGVERHWILDDNINGFVRMNNNRKIQCFSGAVFRCIEDWSDRYENIGMSGMNYRYFASERAERKPFILNTRIYSCILINNSIKHRWRGRYNEDTDLSLRVLKDGWCTALFQTFLCNKVGTMKMKGGNTDTIYNQGDNRLEFAESLQKQHPDVTKVVWRYNRWHHEVDYSHFMKHNKLIFRSDVQIKDEIDNYGMKLVRTNEKEK